MDSRALVGVLLGLVAVGGCGVAGSSKPAGQSPPAGRAADLPDAPKRLAIERLDAAREAAPAPLLTLLETALRRSMGELRQQETKPYYVAYQVEDREVASIEASEGLLVDTSATHKRLLDVDVRVGSPALDNTHGDAGRPFVGAVSLPLADDPLALGVIVWRATEDAYQDAVQGLIEVKAAKEVQAAEADDSPDFSREPPARYLESPVAHSWDRAGWEQRIRELSARFQKYPEVERSYVKLHVEASTRTFASSEDTRIQSGSLRAWVAFGAESMAVDGTVLRRDEDMFGSDVSKLPGQAELLSRIDGLVGELRALRAAPPGDPYVGPALLDGLAAAVLFHEVLGHRAEGHRLRKDYEGQTFARKVGERVAPPGLDVFDDPRIDSVNGVELNGTYAFDDEGVAAQRANLLENGVFRGFLMSRTPSRGFLRSNGHGRKQLGFRAVSRQGNLIVNPARVTTREALRGRLIADVERQGLPFGLRVSRVMGGVAQTTAEDPQAFRLEPVLVYRVFPDGREELIRGVTLEGTPLSLLSSIVAAGNDFAVFNGLCGAESGELPVSATSPSLLVAKVEVSRASSDTERPMLLSPPASPEAR